MLSFILLLNIKVVLEKTHFSILNYSNDVVGFMTVELLYRLQRAQNHSIWFIFNLRRRDRVTPFFQKPYFLKLNELRQFDGLITLHSTLYKSLYLSYWGFVFHFWNKYRRRTTLISIPIYRASIFQNYFTAFSVRLWSVFQDHVIIFDSRAHFWAGLK